MTTRQSTQRTGLRQSCVHEHNAQVHQAKGDVPAVLAFLHRVADGLRQGRLVLISLVQPGHGAELHLEALEPARQGVLDVVEDGSLILATRNQQQQRNGKRGRSDIGGLEQLEIQRGKVLKVSNQ